MTQTVDIEEKSPRRPVRMTPEAAENFMRRCGWEEKTIRMLMRGESLPRWPIGVGCLLVTVKWHHEGGVA